MQAEAVETVGAHSFMGQQRDEHQTWQQHQAGKDACQHYTMWTSMSRALWNEAQTQAVQCTARNHHCTASCDVLQCSAVKCSAEQNRTVQ